MVLLSFFCNREEMIQRRQNICIVLEAKQPVTMGCSLKLVANETAKLTESWYTVRIKVRIIKPFK